MGNYREVRNPADINEVVGLSPIGTEEHLDAAVAAASSAFAKWRHSSTQEREAACQAIADIISDNAAELQELLTPEQGKPLKGLGSEFEIAGCVAWTRGRRIWFGRSWAYTSIKVINAAA